MPLTQVDAGLLESGAALEEGADTSTIVAEKNRLRDITKLADTATTLDELKNIQAEPEAAD